MSDESRCPSCGHENPAGAAECSNCNFPLKGVPAAPAEAAAPESPAAPVHASEPEPEIRPMRPIRPRRPAPAGQALQTQLWIFVGAVSVALVLYTAFQGFKKNNPQVAVAGAKEDQQHAANLARETLEKDSTNVNAQIALANVLYDTANWSEAIIHYKSAARLDSTRTETYVDMGVCYYNSSQPEEALELFQHALRLDPHHPVALFNMGVVSEGQGRNEEAVKYYHQAMQASPPDNMKQPLMEALQRAMQKTGKQAPPLQGAPGAGGGAETPK